MGIAKIAGNSIEQTKAVSRLNIGNIAKFMGQSVAQSAISYDTITPGAAAVFESASTNYHSVCMMDSTHAIVCYRDNGNSGRATACCLTLSGTTITAEIPVVFDSSDSSYMSVCMMDSTHAIVCYAGNSNRPRACCLTLSGTTITVGASVILDTTYATYISSCMMDSTHAIACYRDSNSGYIEACYLTLSGTTITAETPVACTSVNTTYNSVCRMDATHVMLCYRDDDVANYGTACCLTLSGTTISAGTPVVFESAQSNDISVCMMDSTHAIVCYRDMGNSNRCTACCLTLSGTTVSAGTPAAFESDSSSGCSVSMLDSTHAIVCYSDSGPGESYLWYGTACYLTLSGTTISSGTPVVFKSSSTAYISASVMDSTHVIVCYSDTSSSFYGTATCLALS